MPLIVSLSFLAVSVVFAIELRRFHFDTLLAPLVILIPLIILLCIQVVKDIIKLKKDSEQNATKEDRAEPGGKKGFSLKSLVDLDAPYKVFIWFVIFMFSCYLISIPLAALLFVFLYLKFIGKEKWLTSTLIALGTAGFIHVVFGVLIGVDFFGASVAFS